MDVWKLADLFPLDDLCERLLRVRYKVVSTVPRRSPPISAWGPSTTPSELVDYMIKSISALYQNERAALALGRAFKLALLATTISGFLVLAR